MKWYHDLDLKRIQKEFCSPLYIIGVDQLKTNIEKICCFTEKRENIIYPIKANPALAVLQLIAESGLGADCASLQEINLALFSGFSYKNIVYNSPFQEIETCLLVLRSGGTIVLDDLLVMDKLSEFDVGSYPGKIWIRVNPLKIDTYTREDKNQDLMSHCGVTSKFGIPEENLNGVFERTKLKISGLHIHVGTQMNNLLAFKSGLVSLYNVASVAAKYGHTIESIDIGGGLGIDFTDNDKFPSIDEWANELNSLKNKKYQHFAEPGHSLIGKAVCLLTEIKTIKESRGKKWGICDVGTDQLAKITFLKWPHKIYTSKKAYLPMSGNDILAGSLCFAGDTLLKETDLSNCSIGDPLLITNAGAYIFSLANNFNGRTIPGWVIYEKSSYYKTTDRERIYNRNFLQYHYWHRTRFDSPIPLEIDAIKQLQSDYLNKLALEEKYEFLKMNKIAEKTYCFYVRLFSPVDFISMPFAIRFLGDAAIVVLLKEIGSQLKDRPVWGQKLDLEYFDILPTNKTLEITVAMSEVVRLGNKIKALVCFSSVCDKIRGTILLTTSAPSNSTGLVHT